MKKIIMLAMVCSLATAAFADNRKPKKIKKAKQTTQQNCKPSDCKPSDCKPGDCCIFPQCMKA
ncbi:MAG TPA: hypothetical protein VK489_15275 [Ferruginibacter sp.]|nr:hypothetical protein [Ferruginibacter sp.]